MVLNVFSCRWSVLYRMGASIESASKSVLHGDVRHRSRQYIDGIHPESTFLKCFYASSIQPSHELGFIFLSQSLSIRELPSLCALHNDLLPIQEVARCCKPCKQLNHKTRRSSRFACKSFFSTLFLLSILHCFR